MSYINDISLETLPKWKQFSTLSDWHNGPSLVQVHIVHGLTRLASPVLIFVPPTLHATLSFHNSKIENEICNFCCTIWLKFIWWHFVWSYT